MTARVAESAAVKRKAEGLAVRYLGRGAFVVASGSEPGKTYTVQAPYGCLDTRQWTCDCPSNLRCCSHVRAAGLELGRLYRQKREEVPA